MWTNSPGIILALITFPSFKFLFLKDDTADPSMSVLAESHSHLVPETDLKDGGLRLLDVYNSIKYKDVSI